ncbi:MAG: D-amino acid dehydrogenase [Gammaproteobacteria bacterium]|nr:D-amino acid dehydrogenase [Gammaproteobacteria bacterium]
MKILVLGGGVIGVTSAYYLQQAGHEVTLLDRQTDVGLETSYANGGQLSWGAGHPWAAPEIPWKALKWMFSAHSPLVLRPRWDPSLWLWLLKLLRNCTAARYAMNKERMLRLARYSHECLGALRQATGIHYQEHTHGILELFRDHDEMDKAARDAMLFKRWGVPCEILDRAACVAQEPALTTAQDKIVGGVHFAADETGDCNQFTRALATLAASQGVQFKFSTRIERLLASDQRLTGVLTDKGEVSADAYVLACGSYSPLLLRPLGINLPVYPVKGYSVSLPLSGAAALLGSVTDSSYKVVVTRLGDTLRGAGTAELAGYDLTLTPARCATITHVINDLFPGAADIGQAQYWCGLRPMTPDNPPILGTTPYQNLFLNTGHGTLGWTMACGSGKTIADIISGREPEINLYGLTLARFS